MAQDELTFTPQVASSGKSVTQIKVRNGLDTWTITQISVSMPTAPAGSTCEVRKNTFLVSPAVPTGDTVAGEPPIQLRPSDVVTVEWAGCVPGQTGQVLVFFDDGRQ